MTTVLDQDSFRLPNGVIFTIPIKAELQYKGEIYLYGGHCADGDQIILTLDDRKGHWLHIEIKDLFGDLFRVCT